MDWGEKGKSLERLNKLEPTNSEDNWVVTLNDEGGTPGKINSSNKSYVDLTIEEIELNESTLDITIMNIGKSEASNTTLKILENSSTLFSTQLNLIESLVIEEINLSELDKSANEGFNLEIIVYNIDDVNNENDTLKFYKEREYAEKSLLINEIMFDVSSEQQEYIELYNNSKETINLNGFSVADETMANNKEKSYVESEINIKPKELVVIATDVLKKFEVNQIILSDNFALNNSGDDIHLYDPSGKEIDFVEYTESWHDATGDTKNISIEKIDSTSNSNIKSNWKSCDDKTGGTPGENNSEKPIIYDIELTEITLSEIELKIEMLNNTRIEISDVEIIISEDNESIYSRKIDSISAFDNFNLNISLSEINKSYDDNYDLRVISFHPKDTIRNNDTLYFQKRKNIEQGSLLINEIMFDVSENNSEYIEVYNASGQEINLLNFGVADETMKDNGELTRIQNDLIINPEEYAVISYDTLFNNFSDIPNSLANIGDITLNNSGDKVFLYDTKNQIIDSIYYSSDWHESYLTSTKGRSLEKISPNLSTNQKNNWRTSSSDNGGTPGKKNSMVKDSVINNQIEINPNPFSVSNSSFEYSTIKYKNPFDEALLDVTLFKPNGQKITDLVKSDYINNNGQVNWNGRTEEGKLLPIGPYVILLEFTDQDSGEYKSYKKVIVLAD